MTYRIMRDGEYFATGDSLEFVAQVAGEDVSRYSFHPDDALEIVQAQRAAEYPKLEAVLVALWEAVIENRPESAENIQAVREYVKEKHPKPTIANDE